MLTKQELNAVITLWKEQYGVQKTSRNGNPYMAVPNSTEDRRNALHVLINTLFNQYHYTREDFNTLMIARLVEFCTYSDWEEKNKLRKWQEQVESDIVIVIKEYFDEFKDFVEGERKTVKREVKIAPVYEKPVSKEIVEQITKQHDIEKEEINDTPESLVIALTQDELASLAQTKYFNANDLSFLADVVDTAVKNLSERQLARLDKMRKKAINSKKIEELRDTKPAVTNSQLPKDEEEIVELKKPLDMSIFDDVPEVNSQFMSIDEFLKDLEGSDDEQ